MGMTKRLSYFVLFLLLIQTSNMFGQIKVKELPNNEFSTQKLDFVSSNQLRKTIPLDKEWKIFMPDSDEQKAIVSIPSSFSGANELVFKKNIKITQSELSQYNFRLYFLSVNYSAEIYFNGQILFKVPAGKIPFTVDIPNDLITTDKSNSLTIIVNHSLDSEITLPTKNTFLFPKNSAGFLSDVYLQYLSKSNLGKVNVTSELNSSLTQATIKSKVQVFNSNKDKTGNYTISYILNDLNGTTVASSSNVPVNFNEKEEISLSQNLTLNNPVLWYPETPAQYTLKTILSKDNVAVDESINKISFFAFSISDNEIKLNNNDFTIKGVVYHPTIFAYNDLISYNRLKSDLMQIKNTGFNTVRFTKNIPPLAALSLCSEIGLLSFVEIPINSIPIQVIKSNNYNERILRFTNYYLESFRNFYSIAAIGLGSSYISEIEENYDFLTSLAKNIKKKTNKLTFVSFSDIPSQKIDEVDFYGIEFYARNIELFNENIENLKNAFGLKRLFVSEATYPIFNGSTNGYKNEYSYEAQAKYFEDLISYVMDKEFGGLVINSMYDYQSEYSPFATGYNKKGIVEIGLIDENRNSERLAYKVVRSKLNKEEKITIPMGFKKDTTPLFFIIVGLFLAGLLALLFNAKRKFREDAIRALLRPYNFYADIRDQRILSGFHSNFLMVVLSGAFALVTVNITYYMKNSVFVERLFTSFGSYWVVKVFSYLSWNPLQAFFYLFGFCIVFIFIISLLIRSASFFSKNKVLFSSVYYTVTWSFLPYALMLPLGITLYRIFEANFANIYVLGFMIFLKFWVLQRVLKGIYVIYDIRPSKVYFISAVFLIGLFGSILFYYHIADNAIYYLINAFYYFSI